MMMPICIKKLSNTEAELQKSVAYNKTVQPFAERTRTVRKMTEFKMSIFSHRFKRAFGNEIDSDLILKALMDSGFYQLYIGCLTIKIYKLLPIKCGRKS